MSVTTRFAPSPTGYLHIGGARTALYCYLYAKRHQGQMLLRIEDTDRERSTQSSIDAILDSMHWLGIEYAGEAIYQTKRFDRYKEIIDKLLAENKAYRCYCTKQRLDELREQQMQAKQKPRYDGCCRELNSQDTTKPHVIRFKNPNTGTVVINDLVHGEIVISNSELDDLIIARTDGTPTYNFTVVVDDWDMKITHVIRGDDHVNNTPRQINLFEALGAKPPQYAHVPMILGADGKRLSKRHGAASVMEYREQGILPEALLNYLVRLGWSHGDQELFSMQEMMTLFSLEKINNSPASVNPEKLLWINQHYMKTLQLEQLLPEYEWHLQKFELANKHDQEKLQEILLVLRERCKTMIELVNKSRYLFLDDIRYDEAARAKHIKDNALDILQAAGNKLAKLESWQDETIQVVVDELLAEFSVGMAKVAQPLRIALTGNTDSPPITQTIRLLAQSDCIKRITNLLGLYNKYT